METGPWAQLWEIALSFAAHIQIDASDEGRVTLLPATGPSVVIRWADSGWMLVEGGSSVVAGAT